MTCGVSTKKKTWMANNWVRWVVRDSHLQDQGWHFPGRWSGWGRRSAAGTSAAHCQMTFQLNWADFCCRHLTSFHAASSWRTVWRFLRR